MESWQMYQATHRAYLKRTVPTDIHPLFLRGVISIRL
jgi:hypothetical protein